MWRAHDGMGWWMLFGSMWTLVLLALLIWLAVRIATTGVGQIQPRDPLDIARERYARGEIDRDDFERIRRDLDARAGP